MSEVLLLNSGGLDSALLAAILSQKLGHTVHSLHIDTHQINREQTALAAQETATRFCASHKVIELDLGQTSNYWEEFYVDPPAEATMYDAAPNEVWKQTPKAQKGERPFQHFHICPNWTMLIVSIGVAYAKTIGVEEVFTGHRLSVREQFFLGYNDVATARVHKATRAQVNMPLHADPSYREVAARLVGGLSQAKVSALKSEFSYTYSCRWPTPCGVCEKCQNRSLLGLT